ncbi:carbonic anhydrase [Streptomyces sp. DG2A-72]|uniref:carbonic anhydrase n=1 Tax=Streptomyces sp. DG2A-72 TaxID=3051386 RepID=UPI00265B7B2B|nr:carbonic anhydrase [Streptomyces sp. DG2A-72]MDO0937330.1 carbonic anhydrase [Streptomyces sp. DG2A-72]
MPGNRGEDDGRGSGDDTLTLRERTPDSPWAAFARLMEGNEPMTSGTPLIVVLGHQRCGAVKAAYKALKEGKPLPGNLRSIAEALRPAYAVVSKEKHADPVDAMVRVHIEQTSADLRSNADLAPLVKKGDLAVVSAYCSLDTGRVEVLTGAPSA